MGGVWEEPNVDDCICTEENKTTSGITLTWPLTLAGETSITSCPNTDGNATRNCTVGGVWEEPVCLMNVFVSKKPRLHRVLLLMWASTPIGQIAVLSCPNTDGNATRRLY